MAYDGLNRPRARLAALLVVVGLGACSTTGEPVAGNEEPVAGNDGATATENTANIQPSDFVRTGYCPPIEIQPQTEVMRIYEPGHEGEADYVRFQGSIFRIARECRTNGTTLSIKVGIGGRVVAGPEGGAGSVTLPVRIAVVKQLGGEGPLYSELFHIPVTVGPPTFGTNFDEVFDQVSVEIGPRDKDLVVFVGFDEGPE